MSFIIFLNVFMMLILLGCAVLMALSFVYDLIYYDGILKLVLDIVFAFIFSASLYVLGKSTINLLI